MNAQRNQEDSWQAFKKWITMHYKHTKPSCNKEHGYKWKLDGNISEFFFLEERRNISVLIQEWWKYTPFSDKEGESTEKLKEKYTKSVLSQACMISWYDWRLLILQLSVRSKIPQTSKNIQPVFNKRRLRSLILTSFIQGRKMMMCIITFCYVSACFI